MSTHFNIVCYDCNPRSCDTGLGYQHRNGEDLAELLKHADTLANLAPLHQALHGLDIKLGPHSCIDLDFFARHRNHRLRVRCEYGWYLDSCAESFFRTADHRWAYCGLAPNHEGGHEEDPNECDG